MAKPNPTTDNYERIMNELSAKQYKPIYMLMGAEPYFIDAITNYIAQNVLTPDEQAFNLTMLYGETTSAREIDVAARRFPMMAERQVIIVKEAQQVKKIEELARYAAKPLPSTLLVLCFKNKTPDKRTAFYKALAKTSEMYESEPFKSYDTGIFDWIMKYLQAKGYAIERSAAARLVEALGTDVAKIVSELDRLMMMLPAGTKKITPTQVEYLGVSKDYNSFELCSALMHKDKKKVQQIINYFEKNPKNFDLQPTLGVLFSQYTKLFGYQMLRIKYKGLPEIPAADLQAVVGVPPFIIKKDYAPAAQKFTSSKTAQILSAIRQCDVRSKGWGGAQLSGGDLLKELSFIITH
jgi:DNA polymerase-3 subunit delta